MIPRIALVVIGHRGGELRRATVESWHARAQHYEIARIVNVDDSHNLLGFCGAIRYAWERLRDDGPAYEYVFHLEEDWQFDRWFSIAHMARLLATEPQVCQVALRRGAEPSEDAPVVETFPEDFVDRATGMIGLGIPARSQEWLEHSLFWTTNPCLYRADLVEFFDWPPEPACEARFTEIMRANLWTMAYWGDRHDDPWITHTGASRDDGHSY